MGTDSIRHIIAAAKQQERQTHALHQHLDSRLAQLGQQLVLPKRQPVAALVAFVEQYIDYVPEFIEGVMQRSQEYKLQGAVAPFMHMAEDFFMAPPEELGIEPNLQGLLDEAFLAQRLIEEVNDRYIQLRRIPLLPVDMTRANIIVHHLIGDALANRLNLLVEQSVTLLIDQRQLFRNFSPNIDTETSLFAVWQNLPCLSRNAAIDLRLDRASQSFSG